MSFFKNNKFDFVFLILFVLYTIIVMLLFTDKGYVFWVSYIFTVIAFIIQYILIYYLIIKNEGSSFNNFPLLIIGNSYLIIQIIVSIILMFDKISLEYAIVIQSIILGIFIIIEILLSQGKGHIESVEEDTKNRTLFLTEMKKEVEILSNKVDDDLKDNFNDLFEVVSFANPMSDEKISSIENEIIATLETLKNEVNQNNKENILKLINKLEDMFSERDVLLKK